MSHFIYSTHTNTINYVEYDTASSKNHNVIKRKFIVAGGHGLCNKQLVTPQGVVTRVEKDQDLDWLMTLPAFVSDIKKGFIRVQKRKEDSEKVVNRDMNQRDGSAPILPKEYKPSDGTHHSYSSISANQGLIL